MKREIGSESTNGKNPAPDTTPPEKVEIRCLPAIVRGIAGEITGGKACGIQDD